MFTRDIYRWEALSKTRICGTAPSFANAMRNVAIDLKQMEGAYVPCVIWKINEDGSNGEVVFTGTLIK